MKSTKVVCILLVLVITASALGCIGQKKEGASTKTPLSTEKTTPVTSIAQTNGLAESDITMTESDITQLDSMMNDMSMDIFLSDVNI